MELREFKTGDVVVVSDMAKLKKYIRINGWTKEIAKVFSDEKPFIVEKMSAYILQVEPQEISQRVSAVKFMGTHYFIPTDCLTKIRVPKPKLFKVSDGIYLLKKEEHIMVYFHGYALKLTQSIVKQYREREEICFSLNKQQLKYRVVKNEFGNMIGCQKIDNPEKLEQFLKKNGF